MTILKNVYIKSHLSILRVPRGKNAQYQYVKDLSSLHKEIRQGLYVFFGPLVSEAVSTSLSVPRGYDSPHW